MSFAKMRRLQSEACQFRAEAFRIEAAAERAWEHGTEASAKNSDRLAIEWDRMAAENLADAIRDEEELAREAKP